MKTNMGGMAWCRELGDTRGIASGSNPHLPPNSSVERIIPSQLSAEELWKRNGEYVPASHFDRLHDVLISAQWLLGPDSYAEKQEEWAERCEAWLIKAKDLL